MKVGKKAELNINRWADKEGFEKSYIPERVLSGTGALGIQVLRLF